jgi:hypothetical protein
MKHVLVLTSILLMAGVSQAKTFCTVETGNHDMNFTHVIYSGELTTPKYILISKDQTSVREVSDLANLEWKAINGQTLVTFSTQEPSMLAIVVSEVDLSKKADILPVSALATGPVELQKPLVLIVPAMNLSANCMSL